VASFRDPEDDWQLDHRLFTFGPVALYYRPAVLDEDLAWFASEGYRIDEFDCLRWDSEATMHADLADTLAFPDYYGGNVNALDECLRDALEVPNVGGRAIVLRRLDAFAERDSWAAQRLLNSLAWATWDHLLYGRRLLTLAQSDHPRLRFDPVGGHDVGWNYKEFLDSSRGL
jgi:RNAse (barnase) inhibitor barstar